MRWILFVLALTPMFGFCGSSEPIDIGELKVHGNVRRPAVEFYQLQSLTSNQVKALAEMGFDEFETMLLTMKVEKHGHDTSP